jgi:hypothetical protein
MDNATDESPIVLAPRTGRDLRKKRFNGSPGFVAQPVLVCHDDPSVPAVSTILDRKTSAISSILIELSTERICVRQILEYGRPGEYSRLR